MSQRTIFTALFTILTIVLTECAPAGSNAVDQGFAQILSDYIGHGQTW